MIIIRIILSLFKTCQIGVVIIHIVSAISTRKARQYTVLSDNAIQTSILAQFTIKHFQNVSTRKTKKARSVLLTLETYVYFGTFVLNSCIEV